MGGVPVKHHSKGKVGRRRSHLALKKTRLMVCENCNAPIVPHRACANCGRMPGRAASRASRATAASAASSAT